MRNLYKGIAIVGVVLVGVGVKSYLGRRDSKPFVDYYATSFIDYKPKNYVAVVDSLKKTRGDLEKRMKEHPVIINNLRKTRENIEGLDDTAREVIEDIGCLIEQIKEMRNYVTEQTKDIRDDIKGISEDLRGIKAEILEKE